MSSTHTIKNSVFLFLLALVAAVILLILGVIIGFLSFLIVFAVVLFLFLIAVLIVLILIHFDLHSPPKRSAGPSSAVYDPHLCHLSVTFTVCAKKAPLFADLSERSVFYFFFAFGA